MPDFDEHSSLLHPPSRSIKRPASVLILICCGLERFAFYEASGSLILLTGKLGWSSVETSTALLLLNGGVFAFGLFSGWLSDSLIGRYYALVLGYLLYIVGLLFLATIGWYSFKDSVQDSVPDICPAALDWYDRTYSILLTIVMAVVALGGGIVRINLTPFGAAQAVADNRAGNSTFFTCYYMSLNIGGGLALLCMLTVSIPKYARYGLIISASAIVLSFCLFIAGGCKKLYTRFPADINYRMLKSIIDTYKTASRVRSEKRRSSPFRSALSCLDYAKHDFGGDRDGPQVDQVKALQRTFIVFILLLPYWFCYTQLDSNLFILRNGNESCNSTTPLNASSYMLYGLDALDNAVVVALLCVIQPLYRLLNRCGVVITAAKRIGFGMIVAALSTCIAAMMMLKKCDPSVAGGTECLWWQAVPLSLLGASEVFVVVTGLEYAYGESPKLYQGIIMGLFWCMLGIGNFLGAGFQALLRYLNHSHNSDQIVMIYYCFLLVVLITGLIIFILIAKKFDLGLQRTVAGPARSSNHVNSEHYMLND